MKVGVLALQGAFIEHIKILQSLGVDAIEVRKPEQLRDLDGLIIPGGESTTIGKLAVEYGLIEPIREMCHAGKPVWGTCAGMIFLAKDVGMRQPLIGVMDVQVRRNAFGRQVDSFEADLDVPTLASVTSNGDPHRPFHAIFIRAPMMESVGKHVEVLAKLDDGTIVAARQGNLLATSFHPELTGDTRFHRYFVERLKPSS
ncbi:MAG: pyridoxal 5'-phosphate synthase glutaminase subunit PdxT [Chloroflexi bacterium]|nr:pyridoxal 5'-phosphate synthase glutaminase subunit PdxT [Chloroflexota bacterium]